MVSRTGMVQKRPILGNTWVLGADSDRSRS
jgi:hypothetical protein